MYKHKNINNQRFTVRLCTVARIYNIKRVGRLESFLNQFGRTSIPLYCGSVSTHKILEEIEQFKLECEEQ
jgi:hypothetical protein